jgi:hypothetical protein
MKGARGATVRFQDSIRGVADDLELLSGKMRSVVQAMDEHLGPAKEDAHMAGLVGVMDDLVSDVEEFAERANRLAQAKTRAPGPGAPEQKGDAA